LKNILNKRSYQSAGLKTIDLNTAYKVESVPEEISEREKNHTFIRELWGA
jgi:hypothetical protein